MSNVRLKHLNMMSGSLSDEPSDAKPTQDALLKGDLTHTVSPNLMLILSTYRVVLHPSYLQKVFSFIIFIKERYRFTILSEKSRAPGGVPCGRS